ncbi:MAG: hypothetical protein KC493_11950 [Bacteriovoracaceae bacterium]|nr:hypothetical protein [Bacteriovoracaceae bacterium]
MFRLRLGLLLALVLFSSSCGFIQRIGIGTTSPIFYNASKGMQAQSDFENFEKSVLGTLMLTEGLLSIKPGDLNFLVTLTKGYAGYAFAVNETKYLDDLYADEDESIHKDQAITNYSKAMEYGLQYLAKSQVTYSDLQKSTTTKDGVVGLLENEMDDDMRDLEAVLFTAQSLSSLINLQKDNMTLVSQLPIAKGMFDWVCSKKPDIHFGACQIFFGAYEAGRPSMLGGNPGKGKEIFLKLIQNQPNNWLARVAFIQFYVIPQSEEDDYKTQKFHMKKFSQLHKDQKSWMPDNKAISDPAFSNDLVRVYQTIAVKRFEYIKKYEKDLF